MCKASKVLWSATKSDVVASVLVAVDAEQLVLAMGSLQQVCKVEFSLFSLLMSGGSLAVCALFWRRGLRDVSEAFLHIPQ